MSCKGPTFMDVKKIFLKRIVCAIFALWINIYPEYKDLTLWAFFHWDYLSTLRTHCIFCVGFCSTHHH